MRIVSGMLLIVAAGIQLLLGGSYLLASRYQAFKAEVTAEDLSAVSGDLGLSDEEIAGMHREARERAGQAGGREMALAIGLLVLAVASITSGVLVMLRRGRWLAVGTVLLGNVALLLAFLHEGFFISGAIALALIDLSLVLILLRRPRPAPAV